MIPSQGVLFGLVLTLSKVSHISPAPMAPHLTSEKARRSFRGSATQWAA